MKKMFMMLFGSVLLALCGCNGTHECRISVEDSVIIDVRTPEEFKKGHIEGAINISHTEIESDISGKIPKKETGIILYCRSGNRSGKTVKVLKKLGYLKIQDLGSMQNAQRKTGKKIVKP